jgi:hypothetical protein
VFVYNHYSDMVVSHIARIIRETVSAASEAPPHLREQGMCPKCGGYDVRRSANKRIGDDVMMSLFSLAPFRCRSCRGRFFLKGNNRAV